MNEKINKQEEMIIIFDLVKRFFLPLSLFRILSAYRDKMTKLKPLPLKYKFRDLQKAIIAKYRSPQFSDNSTFPTFPEFVQYVIDSTEDLVTAKEWLKVVLDLFDSLSYVLLGAIFTIKFIPSYPWRGGGC